MSRPRRTRLLLRVLGALLVVTALVVGTGFGTALWLQHHYNGNIERFGDPFAALPSGSRPPGAVGAMNVLLLGSDSRISAEDPADWLNGAQRTDAIMIAHLPADRSRVTITSLPKDAPVAIPDHARAPLSDALSFGGPTLMIQTVESLTGVRINHLVILDFEGFREITDDLGGVHLAGATRPMDGAAALAYMRQPEKIPGEDAEQVRRQQAWIRAVSLKTLDQGTLTSPLTLNSVIDSLTRSIAADDGFSIDEMRSVTLSLRKIDGADLTFLTVPTSRDGRTLRPDSPLWQAMARDQLAAWLGTHPH
jgi:anionic cell wall polymer biosynthesis LytR-Cps2A-Psr (LCP) family protein